jgi:ATP-dependent Clp protease ATP-binding subunit ClpA
MPAVDWNEDKYTQAAWSTIAPTIALLSKVADYYQTQAVESYYLLDVLLNPSKHNAGDDAEATKRVVDKILSSAGVDLQELCKALDTFLAKQPKATANSAQKQMGKTLPKVLESARQKISVLGDSFVSAEGLILALVNEDNLFTTAALLKQGVKYTDVLAAVKKAHGVAIPGPLEAIINKVDYRFIDF